MTGDGVTRAPESGMRPASLALLSSGACGVRCYGVTNVAAPRNGTIGVLRWPVLTSGAVNASQSLGEQGDRRDVAWLLMRLAQEMLYHWC